LSCLHYTPQGPVAMSPPQVEKAVPDSSEVQVQVIKIKSDADMMEDTEDTIKDAIIKGPHCERKRCIVGAVVTEDRHQRDASIYSSRKSDPPSNQTEGGVIDVE
jgi:hypothetical protein